MEEKSWRQISTAAEGCHICVMLGSYSSSLNQHVSTGPGFVSFFEAHKLEITESLLLMLKQAWNEHALNRETLVLFEDSTNKRRMHFLVYSIDSMSLSSGCWLQFPSMHSCMRPSNKHANMLKCHRNPTITIWSHFASISTFVCMFVTSWSILWIQSVCDW